MTTTPPARWVADRFVDACFCRADQEEANRYAALGATEALDRELQGAAHRRDVEARRVEATTRDQRHCFRYELVVEKWGTSAVRSADVELAKIGDEWKVVRVVLDAR